MNKITKFIAQIKKIWNLPDYFSQLQSEFGSLNRKIAERTTVHADIGYKGTGSQIIVVGRYRNKDYVRSFNVRIESLPELIDLLVREEKGANVGKFDMIGGFDFSAVYDRDTFE